MGWKRLIIFLTVVLVLAGGGHVLEAIHGAGNTVSRFGSLATRGLNSASNTAAMGEASTNTNAKTTATSPVATGGQTSNSQATVSTTASSGQSATAAPSTPLKSTAFNPEVPHDAPIPKDALRLRIIANSDSAKDQQLKREVRDVIVTHVAQLVANATTEAQAQKIVTAHLPQLLALAKGVVRQHGFKYDVKANVGIVPFPTKVYGNQVYPAGNYKALRFILGKGQGQNWWCVLFPPLCFIDIADGDAIPNTGRFPDLPPLETITVKNMQGEPTQVQVRLASVDYGEELWKTIRNWF